VRRSAFDRAQPVDVEDEPFRAAACGHQLDFAQPVGNYLQPYHQEHGRPALLDHDMAPATPARSSSGSMTAAAPPWSEMVKYDLNTGDIVWRIPTGVQEAPPEYNIPNDTGVQFPRNAPLVTAGGLIFLATGPERRVRAYDRETGKELWVHGLPNGAEGMPATYQVNGRQFVVLPVAQPNATFPARLGNAGPARGAGPAPGGPPAAEAAQGVQAGGAGGRQGRGGGGPALPSAYIAFALPQ
jgi:hypothetical protein